MLSFSKFVPLALQEQKDKYLLVTADLTLAAWNTVAAHRVATVVGTCRLVVIPYIRIAAVGASGTYILGVTGATNAWVASTAVAAMLIDTTWLSTTPAKTYALTSVHDRIVTGANVLYTIGTTAASAGALDFYIWYEPLLPGSYVQPGTGQST